MCSGFFKRNLSKMAFFICDLCGVKFQFKVDIIIHLKDHQSGSIKKLNNNKKKIVKGKSLLIA